ncbi:MAG: hypothetical protein PHS60_15570 [Zavarzinia sp.]|nr:hypothetical protein [Zavarzinia sp.]
MDRERRDMLVAAMRATNEGDDAAALDAMRQANAILDECGLDWDEVIRHPARTESPFMADFDHGTIDIEGEGAGGELVIGQEGDETIGPLLHALLALPGLGADTREEVEEFLELLAAGTLDGQDRHYVIALATRLGVRPA